MQVISDENPKKGEDAKPKNFKEKLVDQFIKRRAVFLWGAVTDKTAEDIVEKMLFLESEDPGKPILFFINSPGGAVTSGMAILDVMHMISSPVYTITMGMAASMGALLFSQGTKGHRYVFSHARVMIHQPLISGQIVAPAVDIKIHAQEIKKTREELNRLLAEATGHSMAKIEKDTDRDYYLNADEAVEYKIADKVLKKISDLPGMTANLKDSDSDKEEKTPKAKKTPKSAKE